MGTKATQILTLINDAKKILVSTHIGPDGDALGSLTAMGHFLESRGKSFVLACADRLPNRFSYLPMFERIVSFSAPETNIDLLIALDCGDESRLGEIYTSLAKPKPQIINIDHHITNSYFGDISLIQPDAVSTTEMLYSLFWEWGYQFTKSSSICLLTGLVTDTLGFRTNSVSAKTLKIAGTLMETGAELALINRKALNTKSMPTLMLWQIGLSHMKEEGGLAWTAISKEERARVGHIGDSSSGLVNLLADIDRVAVGAVLLETPDGKIRVGFRCYPPYSVSELALNLGGGGHALASGCTLDGPLEKAEALVVQMTKEAIQQQRATFNNGRK